MIHPLTAIPAAARLMAVIAALFSVVHPHTHKSTVIGTQNKVRVLASEPEKASPSIRRLAGPYAHLALAAARKAHVPPKLVAAVIHVENGGNFHGSATRVSSAGAIGVMQLEPNTAWNMLRVNPWNARQNIDGGARYLAMMLRQFHGDVQLALMAYNAGPTWIANGGRPMAAVQYAKKVMRDAGGFAPRRGLHPARGLQRA